MIKTMNSYNICNFAPLLYDRSGVAMGGDLNMSTLKRNNMFLYFIFYLNKINKIIPT